MAKTEKPTEELVVFQNTTSGLPAAVQKAIERHGLKVKVRPGVEPTWKPEHPGEYVVGEVLAIRHNVGEFKSTALVINAPGGAVSIWLGADLKTKLADTVRVGQVYCIVYDGILKKTDNPKLKNDMKMYRVVEILENGKD